jgi:hypothetical protein
VSTNVERELRFHGSAGTTPGKVEHAWLRQEEIGGLFNEAVIEASEEEARAAIKRWRMRGLDAFYATRTIPDWKVQP